MGRNFAEVHLMVFTLHPLIHTSPGFAQAQDVEKNAELETPHYLSLNQDVVGWS